MPKKPKNPKKHKGRWELYDASSGLKRKNKSCPKCGQGTFLAQHKDRLTCGKCGYMEKREAVKEEKPAEKKTDVPKEKK
jgi:small subunit ribosomal protein S27Ae